MSKQYCCDCRNYETVQGFPPCNLCYTHLEYPNVKPKWQPKTASQVRFEKYLRNKWTRKVSNID